MARMAMRVHLQFSVPPSDQKFSGYFQGNISWMSHGHFDRLNFCYYDAGNEVVTDYGSARFLNMLQNTMDITPTKMRVMLNSKL